MSPPENLNVSGNGGHGSIEDDEAANISLILRVIRTFVIGCVKEPWNAALGDYCTTGLSFRYRAIVSIAGRRHQRGLRERTTS